MNLPTPDHYPRWCGVLERLGPHHIGEFLREKSSACLELPKHARCHMSEMLNVDDREQRVQALIAYYQQAGPAAKPQVPRREQRRPVVVEGFAEPFPSVYAAAKALGVKRAHHVTQAIRRGGKVRERRVRFAGQPEEAA